jgi:hypothetical protein
MHVVSLLTRWLTDCTAVAHAARIGALLKAVRALLAGGKLTLTHLGRLREGSARVKHHIKAIDRLLGNSKLHAERLGIYQAMARSVLSHSKRPVIIVDWSDFELHREWITLKAAVPLSGRAVCVYEQVFPFKRYNSPGAHSEFLRDLQRVLPDGCRPIIVTDAGFRGPWFREVEALGWHWVGRVRNGVKFFDESAERWRFTDSLYKQATPRMAYLGRFRLARRRGYQCGLYLVRAYQLRRGRHRRRTRRRQMNFRMYRRLHRAPWLLATSLPHDKLMHRTIRRIYEQRMQIEETFRDAKNRRWGFGLRFAHCRTAARLATLLLIGALATLVLWLCGLHAQAHGLARSFQANTERRRPVLSTVFLGQQFLNRQVEHPPPLDHEYLHAILALLIAEAADA